MKRLSRLSVVLLVVGVAAGVFAIRAGAFQPSLTVSRGSLSFGWQAMRRLSAVAQGAKADGAFQRFPGRFYRGVTPAPGDAKHEFAWSRLQYTPISRGYGGYGYRYGGGGFGGWGGTWARDYPKADITFLAALRRLTRIDARSYQQVVNLDNDDIFNYPFVYAVQVEDWTFTPDEAKRLREYLLKGGFLMVDDFHGTADWESFLNGIRMVLPADKYPITDLQDNDEIFHVLYDIGHRFQVPGEQYVLTGRTYEKDGYVPKWRAIRDDKGRVIVAICHNMHLGDAWEWADSPDYPENFASMAFRVGIDYVMYSMTH